MTRPRRELVSLDDTPYYHCVSRCVRRAFLCGEDAYSGNDYSHRKAWVRERLRTLSSVFSVELCAYAVMSNHYHLVVTIDRDAALSWTDDEVIARWIQLFRGPETVQRHVRGETLSKEEHRQVAALAEVWRERLIDLSWYMRCLNEHLARRANAEDGVTGRFWEGRYKSQALLDETALITAMAYVDLNPVRAGFATQLADSDDTSVQQRVQEIARTPAGNAIPLRGFSGAEDNASGAGLPFNLQDYLELVDSSGRVIRTGKGGFIDGGVPRLLEQLGIAPEEWLPTVTLLQRRYELAMGSPRRMREVATRRGRKFFRGYRRAQRFYPRNLTG